MRLDPVVLPGPGIELFFWRSAPNKEEEAFEFARSAPGHGSTLVFLPVVHKLICHNFSPGSNLSHKQGK